MSIFHANDRLSFERDGDGSVYVFQGRGRDMTAVLLDPNTWASVVASVCARGENRETFDAALSFHQQRQG